MTEKNNDQRAFHAETVAEQEAAGIGTRDASERQDGREAVAKWDCCTNCMRPKAEHTMVGKCPDPFTTIWHKWDYDFAPDAKKSATSQQVQADAGVGTAVGRFIKASEYGPWMETSSLVDGQPLYARPDPLLAECVEAIKRVTAFLADPRMFQWSYIEGSEFYGDMSDEVAALRAILAKVQAAKEQA